MRKFAAIDIGSNSVQMLIAEYEWKKLVNRKSYLETTRLGICEENGDLTSKAIADTTAAVKKFVSYAREEEANKMRILATSAVRDAGNRQELLNALADVTDTPVEILDGCDEAILSYKGACASLEVAPGTPVIDSGGSSTELIYRAKEKGPVIATSVDVGAVRAYKNGWTSRDVSRLLRNDLSLTGNNDRMIGVGGTITAIAGVIAGLDEYDRDAIEGMEITPGQLKKLHTVMDGLSIEERCSYSPLLEKRGEIIQNGLEIWMALCRILNTKKIIVCGGGIVDGAICDMI